MTRAAATIRIDAVWLVVHPIDRHVGADPLLASMVHVLGAVQVYQGHLFAHARSTCIH